MCFVTDVSDVYDKEVTSKARPPLSATRPRNPRKTPKSNVMVFYHCAFKYFVFFDSQSAKTIYIPLGQRNHWRNYQQRSNRKHPDWKHSNVACGCVGLSTGSWYWWEAPVNSESNRKSKICRGYNLFSVLPSGEGNTSSSSWRASRALYYFWLWDPLTHLPPPIYNSFLFFPMWHTGLQSKCCCAMTKKNLVTW